MTTRLLVLALLVLTLYGCATSPSAGSSSSASPRSRCLVDPNETGTRPLIFLLCVESP